MTHTSPIEYPYLRNNLSPFDLSHFDLSPFFRAFLIIKQIYTGADTPIYSIVGFRLPTLSKYSAAHTPPQTAPRLFMSDFSIVLINWVMQRQKSTTALHHCVFEAMMSARSTDFVRWLLMMKLNIRERSSCVRTPCSTIVLAHAIEIISVVFFGSV